MPFFLGVIMLIGFGSRFYQLSFSAKHQYQNYNKFLLFRVILLILTIILNIGLVFLSIYDKEYFLYNDNNCSIYLFENTICCAQIGTILYEYNKNVPIMSWHKVYWIIQCLLNIGEGIAYSIEGKSSISGVIFIWGIVLCQLCLIFYSLVIRKQDIYAFENIQGLAYQVPEIDEKSANSIPVQNSFIGGLSNSIGQFRARVQFGRDWKVLINNNDLKIQIKLKVIINHPPKIYKLIKYMQDFVDLEQLLLKEDKFGLDIYKLPEEFYRGSQTGESEILQKIGILKSYINTLVSKSEYYLPALMEFLDFEESVKAALYRDQRRRSDSIDDII